MSTVTLTIDTSIEGLCLGVCSHVVEADTPMQLLQLGMNLYPALYVAVHDSTLSGLLLVLNDEALLEDHELYDYQLQEGDVITILGIVPSGEAGLGTIGAFVTAGTWAANTWQAIAIGFLVMTAVSVAIQVVMGALMGDLEMPDIYSGSMDKSASYTFEGIKNTTASGTPVALVYGTHRVGGQVLSIFTDSEDTDTEAAQDADTTATITETYLFAQYGLSEGEVAGISDVLINKAPVTYYASVSTSPDLNYVRFGSATQTVMPEFDRSMETVSISKKILNASEELNTVPVVYSSYEPVYGYAKIDVWSGRATIDIGLYKLEPYANEVSDY